MGEMAAVVLNSNRVSANKLLSAGFHFEYPTLKEALVNVYK
jgi:NAD dependent epimerase/dehydratase family enzyme